MKSTLRPVSRIAVIFAFLFAAEALFAQMYPQAKPPPAGGASPSMSQPEEAFPSDNPYFRKKPSATPSSGTANAAKMSQKDKSFLLSASSSASWEVKTSSLVQGKLQNPSVKSIATRVIADHSRINNELTELGKKKALAISVESKGQQIPGPNYDKNYLTLLQQDHQEIVALFQKEAQSGDDPEIKAWAKKMLPTLQQHAAAVKQAASKP